MRPILYSFRRCPYAMRARLAILSAGIEVEMREILLRDKPQEMLDVSPKGTVPVLITQDGVIDESRDIMDWALAIHDPEQLLAMPKEGEDWITQIEGPFKSALDRYKYDTRYPGVDATDQREIAADILRQVEPKLSHQDWLFGDHPTLADLATITFVRQYAMVNKTWFDHEPWPGVQSWLERFLSSDRFAAIMMKYPIWKTDGVITGKETVFP